MISSQARWRTLAVVGMALCLVAGPAAVLAEEAKVVRVLIVSDEVGAGKGAEVDGDNMAAVFKLGFAKNPRQLELTRFEGKDISARAILDYYEKLPADASATLVFFYAGHGATDRTKGHLLAFPAASKARPVPGRDKTELLWRADLRKKMQEKQPRLMVLLTDCCASYVDIARAVKRAPLQPDWDTMKCLLLQQRGIVDLNGCTEGEYAWSDNKYGGVFTPCLVTLFCARPDQITQRPDRFVHWEDAFPYLRVKTAAEYKLFKDDFLKATTPEILAKLPEKIKQDRLETRKQLEDQKSQIPQALSPLPPQWRFGVQVEDAPGGGVKVTRVIPHSEADAAGFKVGDVIVKIGARDITNAKQFGTVLTQSRGEIEVTYQRAAARRPPVKVALAPWLSRGKDLD